MKDKTLALAITAKPWRKPIFLISLFLIIIVLVLAFLVDRVYHHPLPKLQPISSLSTSTQNNPVPTPNVVWSPYGQQYIELSGTSLSANNGVQGIFPAASTAKVMMALLILQKKPLSLGQQGPNIPVTADIVTQYQQELAQNESVVAVTNGEELTEYQALEAMLVPSGTNIADLLATWEFGSIDAYTTVANQTAASLGMTDTHFADASGFSPGTVSSAADLVKLGQAALQNPVIAQIVAESSVNLPVAGTVSNFNIDLGQSAINGIKTGNTDQAGGVFLYSAPYDGHTIIGATMNASNLGTALHDAPEILDSFESNLQKQMPITEGKIIASYKLPWGDSVTAIAQRNLSLIDWQGTKIAVHASLQSIEATQSSKKPIGTVSFTFNGVTQSTSVFLSNGIPQPSFWWRILHN